MHEVINLKSSGNSISTKNELGLEAIQLHTVM